MAYEQGLKPLNQVHLSRLSPVMWSLKGGYPRKAMTVPIAGESALGGYDDGLGPLNQVHLSRLSPVMWTTRGGYPRQTLSTKIGPLDMSMGSFDRRYAPVTGWNQYNSVANLRPIAFGSNGDTVASPGTGFWFPFLLAAGGALVLTMLFNRQAAAV